MDEAFGVVVVVVVVLAAIVAVYTLASSSGALDELGKGGLSLRDGQDKPRVDAPPGVTADAARTDDIRQMLEASNARRARRGEAPRDVEAELAELTRPAADPALEDEVRQLVIARNARRARRGQPPLDVEDEVRRQLRDPA